MADSLNSADIGTGCAVVGVSETEPEGKTYQQWMQEQLDALDKAMANGSS
jgi:hypothetical protein